MKQRNNIFSNANYHKNNEDNDYESENTTENNNYYEPNVYENDLYKLYNKNCAKKRSNSISDIPNNNSTYNKNISMNNSNKNKKYNINNNSETDQEQFEISILNEEYSNYITNLKQQISEEREIRKEIENKAKILKHRLIILKNQEQKSLLQFQRIKFTLQNILKNRIEAENRMKLFISLKKNHRRSQSGLFSKQTPSKTIKSNKSNFNCTKSLNVSSIGDFKNKTANNFYRNSNNNSINFEKNFDTKEEFDLNNTYEKNKFREQLLEKLREDQEQKRKIEEEIKKIEEKELEMFNNFNSNKKNSNNGNLYQNNIY